MAEATSELGSVRTADVDGLLAPLGAFGQAAMIAAGPWLLTIVALLVLDRAMDPLIERGAIVAVRLLVTYAFAVSLIVTAPFYAVATRLISDHIYLQRFERTRGLFALTLAASGLVIGIVAATLYLLVLSLPVPEAVAGSVCCALVAIIWVSLAFCGAVRDHAGIGLAFAVGLAVAVAGALLVARYEGSVALVMWGFDAGVAVVVLGLVRRVLAAFPSTGCLPAAPARELANGLRRYWVLGAGAMASAMGIWIDKLVMAMGPAGERIDIGLFHAPLYDAAMFIAYLTIIPSLALLVATLETTFLEHYAGYYAAIGGHCTLAQLRGRRAGLERVTLNALSRILLVQAALCAVAVLSAPVIVSAVDLLFEQTAILRLGTIGALFQFLFLACSSLLLFFERHAAYALLQLLFLGLNGLFTVATIGFGQLSYGFGYLLANLVASIAAFAVLERTLRSLDYLTFVVANSRRGRS